MTLFSLPNVWWAGLCITGKEGPKLCSCWARKCGWVKARHQQSTSFKQELKWKLEQCNPFKQKAFTLSPTVGNQQHQFCKSRNILHKGRKKDARTEDVSSTWPHFSSSRWSSFRRLILFWAVISLNSHSDIQIFTRNHKNPTYHKILN